MLFTTQSQYAFATLSSVSRWRLFPMLEISTNSLGISGVMLDIGRYESKQKPTAEMSKTNTLSNFCLINSIGMTPVSDTHYLKAAKPYVAVLAAFLSSKTVVASL